MSTKVSALTSASPAAGDSVYVVVSGNSRKSTLANLALGLQSSFTTVRSSSGNSLALGTTDSGTLWTITNSTGHFVPAFATFNIGSNSLPVSTLFTTAIDTGSTGSLSLKTNNGTTQVIVAHTGSAVNNLTLIGGTTGNSPKIKALGSDTNISLGFQAQGTGGHDFRTETGASLQFQVLDTASATRNITVTGSAGGNPTINVTAGSLAITPAVVMASTLSIAGASIVTTQTTFACFNTVATTVNAFGAASTALTMGHASGTTTIASKLVVSVAAGNAIGTTTSTTTALNLPASTTGVSTLRVPHGSAPSSPVNGDIWTTTAGLFVQVNGSPVGPLS